MTEQLKAEAYVREQRPALMELSFGCEVEATNNFNAGENDYRDIKIGDKYICGGDTWVNLYEARQKERYKIIGHPIQLQDWLAELGKLGVPVEAYVLENGLMEVEVNYEAKIYFNLTDGQPGSPEDYQSFNEITSV